MFVLKRNGQKEQVHFDKITLRLRNLCDMSPPLDDRVDPTVITQKVVSGLFPGVKTTQLDTLAAETAAYLSTDVPDYGRLAARIAISNLQKQTSTSFSETMETGYNYLNPKTKEKAPLVSESLYKTVCANKEKIDNAIDHSRDYLLDFFGFRTLERSYLFRANGEIIERPQYMFMRVSIGIHGDDLDGAFETYNLMSRLWFTHATPTLFNAGTPKPQLSSCFLLTMQDDSIEGIYDTLKQCALISKSAGGIGLSVHKIRSSNSYIKGTNGTSNGLVPMLRVYNDTARYVDQGGGKRKGAFAIYLEPWHSDIFQFLELKKNTGKEETRARDLFYAMWINDLFMKRVESDSDWSLFCPNEAAGLADVWGQEFEDLYIKYENTRGLAKKVVKAQDLWFAILESQIETGTPYMLYKDSCNRKSNQQNLGTIRSSNLCTEILEYTSKDEVAVCNLASIALPKFVREDGSYDYEGLQKVVKVITINLNKIIDVNFYPIPEARNSNLRHRPIGIGVQGLADVFMLMKLSFDSPEAKQMNKEIFETIYFGALEASNELAAKHGPYESYEGSPASKGILQYDMWGVTPTARWDWSGLKAKIQKDGIRNSLMLAPMPTASTSQILGNNECFEPYTSNIYNRRVLAGEFAVVNKHLLKELSDRGLWTPDIKNSIIAASGSVQNIDEIPHDMKSRYKTVWEISQRVLLDMAADRGAFIDQSQSLNVFMAEPTYQKLTSLHFYAWKKGLKTGMYYLRSRPAVDAIQFTVDQTALKKNQSKSEEKEEESTPPAPVVAGPVAPAEGIQAITSTKTLEEQMEIVGEICRKEDGCIVCGS